MALLAREDVEYISVKVSSVSSQINLVAFRPTIEEVKDRLRAFYRQAWRHHYRHPDGHVTPKFVNLDMEEYRDLDLTVTALQEVLDEEDRPTTGAIVRRQPFGGWKASSMGPGAKAGGPNYVLQLAHWRQVTPAGDAECSPRVAAALTHCLGETSDDAEAAAVL